MSGFDLNLELILKLTLPTAVKGSWDGTINHIASLSTAEAGALSFLSGKKYQKDVPNCRASVVILPDDYEGEPSPDQMFLLHGNPSRAIDLVCENILRQISPKPEPSVHSSANIHPSVAIPDSTFVGPLAVIEEGAIIGENCQILAHAYIGRFAKIGAETVIRQRATVLDYCQIGQDCLLHSGSVIGAEGFGYETIDAQHLRSPQIGIVVLEDHVDVGANTTIDRARFNETRIGQGTKIDNQVQIAHNVTIGKGCFLAAQVGIAGSTSIGDFVLFGGNSGSSGHLTIGDFCQIAGSTAVYSNLPAKSFVSGVPAMPYYQAQRFNVLRKKIPDLFRMVDKLQNHPPSDL